MLDCIAFPSEKRTVVCVLKRDVFHNFRYYDKHVFSLKHSPLVWGYVPILSWCVSPSTPGKLHHQFVDVVGCVCTIAFSFELISAFCCAKDNVIFH